MKSRGFFLLLLVFTAACFIWWVVQLGRLQQTNLLMQKQMLYAEVERAQNQLLLASRQIETHELDTYTSNPKNIISISKERWDHIAGSFPSLHFVASPQHVSIQPKEEVLSEIDAKARKNQLWLLGESALFFSLLFIGFIWIYKGLVDAINLNQQQSNFLISVTHELKTPIATSRILFETLRKHVLAQDKIVELSSSGIHNTTHQLELVESLLIANQLDTNTYQAPKERVNLGTWLKEEIEMFKLDYRDELLIEYESTEDLEIEIDALSLRLSLSNLLSNAVKYGGKNKSIFIALRKNQRHALIQVGDQGPGIPNTDKKHIFKKFYRRGDAFTQVHRGTGLGLFIVAETAKRHGGKVWVEDRIPTGSMFNLTIQLL